jgi:hypothetical protein
VSRWDQLKDPIGVMDGFAQLLDDNRAGDADLVLAGPNVTAIADDPEGAETLDGVLAHWRALPHGHRGRIHLACLPMADTEENAVIVNALQRHATVVVQKSLHEGFGLTVAEAMWKARPVVGSAVGGIQEQIEDGVSGLLLKEPGDLAAFGGLLERLLGDPAAARSQRGRRQVRGATTARRPVPRAGCWSASALRPWHACRKCVRPNAVCHSSRLGVTFTFTTDVARIVGRHTTLEFISGDQFASDAGTTPNPAPTSSPSARSSGKSCSVMYGPAGCYSTKSDMRLPRNGFVRAMSAPR